MEPKRKQRRRSKSYNSDWPEGCQNWGSFKVLFLSCEIDFFMLARLGFFFEKFNVCQPKRGPWSGPGRPRGAFPNFKGSPRDPKVARPLSKKCLGGALGPSRDEKHRNGHELCVFKIVEIGFGFYCISGQIASPERAKCERRGSKSEVGESN